MPEQQPVPGTIGWFDLTVGDAEGVRDFYAEVVGWEHSAEDMGGYDDFNMTVSRSGEVVAGICHARGSNADLPSQWLVYINVADAAASAERCLSLGGEVLVGPRDMGEFGTMFVIRDPAGAVAAILSPSKP